MKKEFLKFGGYSFLLAFILFAIGLVAGSRLSFPSQQVVGFVVIVSTLVISIYFSVKYLRDTFLEGTISFGKALMHGLLITVFVGLGIAVMDYIYTEFINPDYMINYMAFYENSLRETLTAEEFTKEKARIDAIPNYQKSSWYMAFMMYFISVFWGFFVSLAMAMILKRKKD